MEAVAAGHGAPACNHIAIETRVRRRRRQQQVGGAQRDEIRVCRDHQEQQRRREIQDVLKRVHRDAGPGADVHVVMVQRVSPAVQVLGVQQPVVGVKVHRDQREHRHRQRGGVRDAGEAAASGHGPDEVVGVQPHHHRLVQRGDGARADQRPEHVVTGLVAEQEGAAADRQPPLVVLVLGALAAPDEQPPVQTADNRHHERDVAQVDQPDRPDGRGREMVERRSEPEPGHHADSYPQAVLPPEELGDRPARHREPARRPFIQRRERHLPDSHSTNYMPACTGVWRSSLRSCAALIQLLKRYGRSLRCRWNRADT